jgi:hypothetical protein
MSNMQNLSAELAVLQGKVDEVRELIPILEEALATKTIAAWECYWADWGVEGNA